MNIQFQYLSDTYEWLRPLFSATYAIHIAEEYFCGEGFSAHLRHHYGIELSRTRFLSLQILGFLAMVGGLWMASRLHFPNTMLAIFATVVLSNGAIHGIRSISRNCYEPGVLSGIVLWIPLGIATFYLVAGGMTSSRLIVSIVVGLAISCMVELLTIRGGKW